MANKGTISKARKEYMKEAEKLADKFSRIIQFHVSKNFVKYANSMWVLTNTYYKQIEEADKKIQDLTHDEPFYKCGHARGIVVLDDNELSMIGYLDWKDTVGYDGNKSKCWDCHNLKENEDGIN